MTCSCAWDTSAIATGDSQVMRRLSLWIFHPFFIAAYAVLGLLAYNIQQTRPIYALRPLLVSLLLAAMLVLCFCLLLRDWRRAGLAASFWILLFASYGHIHGAVLGWAGEEAWFSSHSVFLPIAAVLAALALWFAARTKAAETWTQALNLMGSSLLLLAVVQIAFYHVPRAFASTSRGSQVDAGEPSVLAPAAGEQAPDIYYIILDMYPRADALATAFAYDNSWFVDEMEQRGFVFPECSQSNYGTTVLSLTSSLNMSMLPEVVPTAASGATDQTVLYPYLQHGRVRETLEEFGYKTVAFETGFSPTEWTDAGYYFAPSQSLSRLLTSGLTPFETLVLQSNMGTLLYDFRNYLPARARTLLDGAYVTHRNRILYVLEELEERAPAIRGPKFVFAHILAPHNPFVFGPDGEVLQRATPFTLNNDRDASKPADYVRGFRDQVNYLDKRLLDVVDSVLAQSKSPPIIVIQGDHGSPRTPDWRLAILNAYYLPDDGAERIYPSISPVNTFRLIFDEYFGGDLGFLPDTHCQANRDASPLLCQPQPDPNPMCETLSQP